jgi:hypothetical protein
MTNTTLAGAIESVNLYTALNQKTMARNFCSEACVYYGDRVHEAVAA